MGNKSLDKSCRNCGSVNKTVWSRFMKGGGDVYGWFCDQNCKAREQIKRLFK